MLTWLKMDWWWGGFQQYAVNHKWNPKISIENNIFYEGNMVFYIKGCNNQNIKFFNHSMLYFKS